MEKLNEMSWSDLINYQQCLTLLENKYHNECYMNYYFDSSLTDKVQLIQDKKRQFLNEIENRILSND